MCLRDDELGKDRGQMGRAIDRARPISGHSGVVQVRMGPLQGIESLRLKG